MDPVISNYKVNVDRGCYIRIHRATGSAVYMYADTPGVFYNDHGKVIPVELAAEAGFDVETLLKAKRKHDALTAAQQEIEKQFAEQGTQREVVAEHGDYRVVGLGHGLFQIEFEDGSPMSKPVSEEIAMATFYKLTGTEPPKPEEPKVSKK